MDKIHELMFVAKFTSTEQANRWKDWANFLGFTAGADSYGYLYIGKWI